MNYGKKSRLYRPYCYISISLWKNTNLEIIVKFCYINRTWKILPDLISFDENFDSCGFLSKIFETVIGYVLKKMVGLPKPKYL
jgi:hypothetical protein